MLVALLARKQQVLMNLSFPWPVHHAVLVLIVLYCCFSHPRQLNGNVAVLSLLMKFTCWLKSRTPILKARQSFFWADQSDTPLLESETEATGLSQNFLPYWLLQ